MGLGTSGHQRNEQESTELTERLSLLRLSWEPTKNESLEETEATELLHSVLFALSCSKQRPIHARN
jgi:hypothetical protein